MIAHLNGIVAGVGLDGAVIEVGGVGLRVQCTPDTLAALKPGEPARVATSLVVREDSLTLFGFGTDDERNVFELLQTASGIGPRLALAMLAVHSPDALRRAVATEDLKALTMVPGVGNKGAQRIILELKDRLGAPGDGPGTGPSPARGGAPSWRDQVTTGLLNLGWSARDADAAVAAVEADSGGQVPDVPTALRAALRKLSRALSSGGTGFRHGRLPPPIPPGPRTPWTEIARKEASCAG
jgi:Holliday junction DNA helicase RuvA